MKKLLLILASLMAVTSVHAEQKEVSLNPVIKTPGNGDRPRSPILMPVLFIDGYTLTASDNTLGSTIQLLDEDDNVVFSTYVSIEGDIQLPASLSGTYTILVICNDAAFVGEITL